MVSKMTQAHRFFSKTQTEELSLATFDEKLEAHRQELVGVFFWGHDCPNCDVAKTMLAQESDAFLSFGIKWFHVNVYENFDLGTRFGLVGIPTFLFFKNGKKLGRISPFPGTEPFFETLRKLK